MDGLDVYTIADNVDEYLAQRQIEGKKYFPSYMICAKYAWKHLFKNTIYAVNSEWKTMQLGVPYNYVDVPRGTVRLFSVAVTDKHNQIVPLWYNNTVNIMPQPAASQKKCGCTSCQCGGLCEDINSLTYTTKVLFTINGVDYIEKDWIKVCPNGDVIEYRIVPTKKYNAFIGDGGEYMNDYMNDYNIGGDPFSDYTIENLELQNTICHLATRPCGCPEETVENIELFKKYCGQYLRFNSYCNRYDHNAIFLGDINKIGQLGTVKMSECGTRIYYIPAPTKHNETPKVPTFLLVNYQMSGEDCTEVVQVPDYAKEAMFYGIDYYAKRFNNAYAKYEKDDAKFAWRQAQNDLIMFLNPLNMDYLAQVQDLPIKY